MRTADPVLQSAADRAHAAARHIDERWPYNPTLLDDLAGGVGVLIAEELRGQGGPSPYGPGDLAAGVTPPGGRGDVDRSYLWWAGQCYAVPPELDGQGLLAWVHAHTPYFGSCLDEEGQGVVKTVLCDACGYLSGGDLPAGAEPAPAMRPAVAVHGRDLVGVALCAGHWSEVTWPRNGTDALRFRQPTQKGSK